jgi:hypothetical protein
VRPTREDLDRLMKRDRSGVPGPGEVTWDKPAPEGPPESTLPPTDPNLIPLLQYFSALIEPEAILLDMCVDRSMEIVRQNVRGRSVGIDDFAEGNPTHPMNIASIAAPLAVELYRQCIDDVKKDPAQYVAAIEACRKLSGQNETPKIIAP